MNGTQEWSKPWESLQGLRRKLDIPTEFVAGFYTSFFEFALSVTRIDQTLRRKNFPEAHESYKLIEYKQHLAIIRLFGKWILFSVTLDVIV